MKRDKSPKAEAQRAWKKAHPGFAATIHDMVERSFDAGYEAAQGLPTDSETCHSCGAAVSIVWAAWDEDWNKVVGGSGGLRCPKCFAEEALQHGINLAFIAIPLEDGWRTKWYEALDRSEMTERRPHDPDLPRPRPRDQALPRL